jgi:hypothetical protein
MAAIAVEPARATNAHNQKATSNTDKLGSSLAITIITKPGLLSIESRATTSM